MELRAILEEFEHVLRPFSETIEPGTHLWDGKTWSTTTKSQIGDPYAAGWAATFRTAAELFQLQGGATNLQTDWLKKVVFGGMGSFNDFQLDTQKWGEAAQEANSRLEGLRTQLWETVRGNEV